MTKPEIIYRVSADGEIRYGDRKPVHPGWDVTEYVRRDLVAAKDAAIAAEIARLRDGIRELIPASEHGGPFMWDALHALIAAPPAIDPGDA